MWLTKHEKEVLKLLLDDGKLSDTSMADKINISTQAVGRIRKRLEEDIITKYSIELNPAMLGLGIISISEVKMNNFTPKEIEEMEKIMIKEPKNIQVLKILAGEGSYILVSGFKNVEELNEITANYRKMVHQSYEISKMIILPLNCILKNSNKELYKSLIDSCGVKHAEMGGGGNLDVYPNNHRSKKKKI